MTLRGIGLPNTTTASAERVVSTPPPPQEQPASPLPETPPAAPAAEPTALTPPTASPPQPPAPQPLTAVAATSTAATPPPPVAGTTRGPSLAFFDTSRFDKQLSSTMSRAPAAVVVTLEAQASVNNIPERLNKWLSAVEKNDGSVELQPDPDYPVLTQRGAIGVVSVLLGAFAVIYEAIENKILYGPAKGYNATVYYARGSGMMTKVVFQRKMPPAGK
ncbi:MAG: hypothetical protein AB7N91_12685 [Candidatus Tectimicrobiota bacterium]